MPGITGTITVFAAILLTDVFHEIATEYEAANPGNNVELNFAANSLLTMEINARRTGRCPGHG